MRMWMVPPACMCDKHLLGEHGELHKHLHNFRKHHSMTGRIAENCCEPASYKERHDALAAEMLHRKMNHRSPLEQPDISYLPEDERTARVNMFANLKLLLERCPGCRAKTAVHYPANKKAAPREEQLCGMV